MTATAEAQVALTLIDRITGPINRIANRFKSFGTRLGLDRLSTRFRALGAAVSRLGPALAESTRRLGMFGALIGVGGGGIAALTFGLARSVADASKQIANLATLTNMSVEGFQAYSFAAKTVGIEQDKFADILKDVQDKIGDFMQTGGGAMADFFEKVAPKVGITKKAFEGLSGSDALRLYVQSLEKAGLSHSDMVFYMEAIASDSSLLLPLLLDNAKGYDTLAQSAIDAGAVLGADAIEAGRGFRTSLDLLQLRIDGIARTIGAQLLPPMTDFVEKLSDWYDANQKLIKSTITEWVQRFAGFLEDLLDPTSELRKSMASFGDSIGRVYDWIKPLVNFLGGPAMAALALLGVYIAGPLVAAILGLIPPLVSLSAALLATPLGWVVLGLAAIGGAVYTLIKRWDEFVDYWAGLWNRVTSAFETGWLDGVVAVLKEFNPLVHVARGMNEVIEYFTGLDLIAIGANLIGGFIDGLIAGMSVVKTWAVDQLTGFAGMFDIDLAEVGRRIVQSLLDGLAEAWADLTTWLADSIAALTEWMPDWVKEQLGIEVTARVLTDDEIAARAKKAGDDAAMAATGTSVVGWLLESGADTAERVAREESERRRAADAERARLYAENDRIRAAASAGLQADIPTLTTPGVSGPDAHLPEVQAPAMYTPDLAPRMPASVAVPEFRSGAPDLTSGPQRTERMEAGSVQAGSVQTGKFVAPEPLLVHEPQSIDASTHVGAVNITVPPGFTAEQAQGMINAEVRKISASRQADALSALND